ncbi:MAG: hypothetical protein PHV43_03330 [Candidatus Colwellbacteria bacterium]|nr:hypothetical protein [Candidatus Colwellbacteria bacterium]
MLLGHEDKKKIFQRLIQEGRLAHGYLFFGENHIGKFLFARSLANLLENQQFEEPKTMLTETLIVQPEGGSIGIDAVRECKQFLARAPIQSAYRTLLIDNADTLTNQAQNAILKLAEEPPRHALIILISLSPDTVLPTLQSRLQKIYFSRIKSEVIEKALKDRYGITPQKAEVLAKESFGKPGLAIEALQNAMDKNAELLIKRLFGASSKRDIIEAALEDPVLTDKFLAKVMARLAKDPIRNYRVLNKLADSLVKMSDFNTNKRLQLESALWTL